MRIDINNNGLWLGFWLCLTVIIIIITFCIWNYNVKANYNYTKNGYNQVSNIGSTIKYWKKIK